MIFGSLSFRRSGCCDGSRTDASCQHVSTTRLASTGLRHANNRPFLRRRRSTEVTTRLRNQSLDDSYPAGNVLTGWGTLVTITSGEARRETARPAQALLARFELSICSGAKRSLSQDRCCFRRPAAVVPHGRWGRRRPGGTAASAAAVIASGFLSFASVLITISRSVTIPITLPLLAPSITGIAPQSCSNIMRATSARL